MWIYALEKKTKEVLGEGFYLKGENKDSIISDLHKMFGNDIVIIEAQKQMLVWSQNESSSYHNQGSVDKVL